MFALRDSIIAGGVGGIGIVAMGKGHEIALSLKKAHGNVLHWDAKIVRDSLMQRGTIKLGIVAAAICGTGMWVSRATSPDRATPSQAKTINR